MRTIGFTNQKGGTGKTSTAGNIAFLLASKGSRVLIADLDPQANITGWYYNEGVGNELADYFRKKSTLAETAVQLRENLWLLPTISVNGTLGDYAETQLVRDRYAFHDLRDDAEKAGYDFLIFDMSPGMSLLERSAIAVCNEVVLVMDPEFFSVDGFETFSSNLERLKRENRSSVTFNKIVLNKMNESFRRHKIYYDEIDALHYSMFTISQDAKIGECQMTHESIFEYAPKAKTVKEYEALAEAVRIVQGVLS